MPKVGNADSLGQIIVICIYCEIADAFLIATRVYTSGQSRN